MLLWGVLPASVLALGLGCRQQLGHDRALDSRGMRAGLQALDRAFRSYVWPCAR
jgi:hypothetical protein